MGELEIRRNPHKKTRSGCTQCKRRRVKCDERKPTCNNCTRLKQQCSLEFLTPMALPVRLTPPNESQISIKAQSASPPNLAHEVYLPLSSDRYTSELLHHYSTELYSSLANDCPPDVWCVTIPQLGLEYPYIMSGMLSISALQLGSLVPSRRPALHHYALSQNALALPLFMNALSNPTPRTYPAIFAFAASLTYYVMVSPNQADRCRLPSRKDKHPHWFQTTRGMMAFLDTHWPALKGGPLGPLIGLKDYTDYTSLNPDDGEFCKVYALLNLNVPIDKMSGKQQHEMAICKSELDSLRQVAGKSYSATFDVEPAQDARGWVGIVSQEFAELIFERDVRALVIMALYCAVIKRFDHVWYLQGLGIGLLASIRKALARRWWVWIEWAEGQPCSTDFM